ncbi:MAG: hypothetical protein QW561_00010 [Candidatus Aenigmatarchaeota archaeon]
MGKYRYITNRTFDGGWIKVLVPADSNTAEVEYKCPNCGHTEATKKEWKRPFSVKCTGCGYLIKVPSLRAEIKKKT